MQIDISVIIVNYNVQAFLEQCLYAVYKASKDINIEVIVVDNNSIDDSVEMLKINFPQVKLIRNSENKGFAYGCNQGLKICTGKFVLLLNPDTIIREDSLILCTKFMNEHPEAGALGVKMIDGKGKFLAESKRSLPTASSAFYKMFGFSSAFPKSKIFGKYQLKYLDKDKIHEVEVLSGAYMFIRMDVLNEIGFLDEDFFMYGEDIDLSYRIIKAGYKNYYFPNTTIIHFKGESTKKASFKYVKTFYNAMLIFAQKHYKTRHSAIFSSIINLAIYLRASLSLFNRLIEKTYIPITDFLITYTLYSILLPIWESYRFMGNKAYSHVNTNVYLISYIFIWFMFVYYFDGFKVFTKFGILIKSIFWGTIIILAGYSLLPENLRFSRAIILIGAIVCLGSIVFNRMIFRLISNKGKGFSNDRKKPTLLTGNLNNSLITNYPKYLDNEYDIKKILFLDNDENINQSNIMQIIDIVKVYKIETIIFFIKNFPISKLISIIIKTQDKNLEFKMILPISQSIVGPQSVIDMNALPDFRLNPISLPKNKIKKRIVDLFVSFLFLFLWPIFITKNNARKFAIIIFKVFSGQMSWVSYINHEIENMQELPDLKPGVFVPNIYSEKLENNENAKNEANINYAKNYKMLIDLQIIYKSLKHSLNFENHLNKNRKKWQK